MYRKNEDECQRLCPWDEWSFDSTKLIAGVMDELDECYEPDDIDRMISDIISAVLKDGGMA